MTNAGAVKQPCQASLHPAVPSHRPDTRILCIPSSLRFHTQPRPSSEYMDRHNCVRWSHSGLNTVNQVSSDQNGGVKASQNRNKPRSSRPGQGLSFDQPLQPARLPVKLSTMLLSGMRTR